MDSIIENKFMARLFKKAERQGSSAMNLTKGKLNTAYTIKAIKANDEDLKNFLFTLGCYEGEHVTIISVLGENYVITVKDARYSIDKDLAEAIVI